MCYNARTSSHCFAASILTFSSLSPPLEHGLELRLLINLLVILIIPKFI